MAEHGLQGVGNGSRSRGREEAEDSAKMVRERGLVDEFVSIRLIDFMAAAKAILDETLHPLAASDDRFYRSLAIADEHLVRALDAELTYRKGDEVSDRRRRFTLLS
ncbi:MAG TPA: hypothetical protein VIZ87_01360 [Terrimicrobium sp.]